MSGWELGLALGGCTGGGFLGGLAFVWWYARRVYRSKVGQLLDGAGALTTMAATGRPVTPPPRRNT